MFESVLIANRGEIAVRLIRACQEMGIRTIAVYSEADGKAMHVRMADQAVLIGPAPARDSYLNMRRIIDAAKKTGAQAIHPGYGFLSERADFAQSVAAAGLAFIGPPVDAMRKMGSKTGARELMRSAGVPIVPGYHPQPHSPEGIGQEAMTAGAEQIGYPVLVKAAAGGGGKGMRIVRAPADLPEAVAASQREAAGAFGDGSVFLEKYIARPRHIEFQVLADSFGNTVHLFERECSIQRRHQKIVEETPSPFLTPDLRATMGAAAVAAARAAGYVNAGTVEFIVDESGLFYFLEMNTRLQVEHPITEVVTGIDLVKAQIRITAGDSLQISQRDIIQRGHAIEGRVYAEDASNGFMPCTGTLQRVVEPVRPGVRVDSGVAAGDEVTIHYDPLIAKVVAHAETREDAIHRLDVALADYQLEGVTTNLPFLRAVATHPAFGRGETTTHFVEQYMRDWQSEATVPAPPGAPQKAGGKERTPWDRADGFRLAMGQTGRSGAGSESRLMKKDRPGQPASGAAHGHDRLEAAMPGQVRAVLVKEGDPVDRGQTLALLEAMKMEIRVLAPHAGTVAKVLIVEGQVVERGQQLFDLSRGQTGKSG